MQTNSVKENNKNIGIVYIFPEATYLGLNKSILKMIASNRIEILEISIIDRFTPHEIDIISKYNGILSQSPLWISSLKFNHGPVFCLLIRPFENEDLNYQMTGFYKELVSIFKPINRALNLVGFTTNSEEVTSAKNIFLKEKNNIAHLTPEEIYEIYFWGYINYKEKYGSFYEVLYSVLHRILVFIQRRECVEYEKILNIVNDGIEMIRTYPQNEKGIINNFHLLKEITYDLKGKNIQKHEKSIDFLSDTIYKFTNYEELCDKELDWFKIIDSLDSIGIRISHWELVVLLTTVYGASDRISEER